MMAEHLPRRRAQHDGRKTAAAKCAARALQGESGQDIKPKGIVMSLAIVSFALPGAPPRARPWRALFGLVAMLGIAAVAVPAQAGFIQQGNKLTGIDAATSPRQGSSAALSADGNTALVGADGDNSNVGTAGVYVRDGNGVWTQQGAKLVGTGAVGICRAVGGRQHRPHRRA
jgi:hypothetical protein